MIATSHKGGGEKVFWGDRRRWAAAPIFASILSIFLAAGVSAAELKVAAAISLREALTQIGKSYEADTHNQVEFTFGSSGQLMAQIQNGAPIDAFISAANKQMDDLAAMGLIDPPSRRVVVGNALVLIVPADDRETGKEAGGLRGFEDLLKSEVKRVAIGEPKTVPAGQYALETLKSLRLAEPLAQHIVYGANVRQVLDYVERGEVQAGLVYATDARQAGAKVRVIAAADPSTHEPIVYPGVVLKASIQAPAARQFLDYLAGAKARAIFFSKGFTDGRGASMMPATQPATQPATMPTMAPATGP